MSSTCTGRKVESLWAAGRAAATQTDAIIQMTSIEAAATAAKPLAAAWRLWDACIGLSARMR